jgi:pyridoxine 5'-phosphate synthase PdxJ
VARAVFVGLETAVKEMIRVIRGKTNRGLHG